MDAVVQPRRWHHNIERCTFVARQPLGQRHHTRQMRHVVCGVCPLARVVRKPDDRGLMRLPRHRAAGRRQNFMPATSANSRISFSCASLSRSGTVICTSTSKSPRFPSFSMP
jgi:hypothetical protein